MKRILFLIFLFFSAITLNIAWVYLRFSVLFLYILTLVLDVVFVICVVKWLREAFKKAVHEEVCRTCQDLEYPVTIDEGRVYQVDGCFDDYVQKK